MIIKSLNISPNFLMFTPVLWKKIIGA